jgi:hypothetical protein
MHPPKRMHAPEALATGLKARLGLVLFGLGWRHDDVALDMYRHAEHLGRYAAAVTAALEPARAGRPSQASALAAAGRLDEHLAYLDRVAAVHGAAIPAARRTLARLVDTLSGPPHMFR